MNPEDVEDLAKAERVAERFMRTAFPMVAVVGVVQADGRGQDGEGGKVHVHQAVSNVLLEDFELNGKLYRKGSALGGELTSVERLRGIFDECCEAEGLNQRNLPYTKGDKRTKADQAARRAGTRSDRDVIKDTVEEALLAGPRTMQQIEYEFNARGVELRSTLKTRGKYKGQTWLEYRLDGTTSWHTDHALGLERYGEPALRRAMRNPKSRTPRTVNPLAGPPKALTQVTAQQQAEAAKAAARLSAEGAALREKRELRLLTLRYESLGVEPIVEETQDPEAYWARVDEQAELIGKLRLTPEQLEAENVWVEYQVRVEGRDRADVEAEWPAGASVLVAGQLDDGVTVEQSEAAAHVETAEHEQGEQDDAASVTAHAGLAGPTEVAEEAPPRREPTAEELAEQAREEASTDVVEPAAEPKATTAEPTPARPASRLVHPDDYRSGVRGLKPTSEKARVQQERVVEFDEYAYRELYFSRPIVEDRGDSALMGTKGIGEGDLDALVGQALHPLVRAELKLRVAKRAEATRLYEAGDRVAGNRLRAEAAVGNLDMPGELTREQRVAAFLAAAELDEAAPDPNGGDYGD